MLSGKRRLEKFRVHFLLAWLEFCSILEIPFQTYHLQGLSSMKAMLSSIDQLVCTKLSPNCRLCVNHYSNVRDGERRWLLRISLKLTLIDIS